MKNIDPVFLEEETRCGYEITALMKHVWAVELDLAVKLKEVCEKYDLKYFMAGGTLLGAVRHKGFVPWDDDIDISMPRDDFEKLKQVAPLEFQFPYFLQTDQSDPDVFIGIPARLVNCSTTCIESLHEGHSAHFGIWVDITVLDQVFEEERRRRIQLKRTRHWQLLTYAKIYPERKKFTGLTPFAWMTYKVMACIYSREHLNQMRKKCMTSCDSSNYVASFSYRFDRYEPFLFEKEIFRDSVPLDFESVKLSAPIEFDRCLRIQYGNYMDYPSQEKRGMRHAQLLDPFIPYDRFTFDFQRITNDLQGKAIMIFGAGQMLGHYMENEGKQFPPRFAVDNDSSKWETQTHGITVKRPDALMELQEERRIIICSIYYKEIAKQLRDMGIDRFYIYVQDRSWL